MRRLELFDSLNQLRALTAHSPEAVQILARALFDQYLIAAKTHERLAMLAESIATLDDLSRPFRPTDKAVDTLRKAIARAERLALDCHKEIEPDSAKITAMLETLHAGEQGSGAPERPEEEV